MRGLVLAGGSGTRLRPLTYTGAKQLVPVANRPILFYVVDNLVAAGITDIGVIIAPETGREIQSALGDGSRFGARCTFILQDRPGGLAHAILTARAFLGDEPFVTYLGDTLLGSSIRPMVEAFEADPTVAGSILLKEVADPTAFGVAEVDSEGKLVRLVEKPQKPRSNLALVGVYLFRPGIFDAIAQIGPSARGELEITDAIAKSIELGRKVNVTRLASWWLDTGKKDDLLLANDVVLDEWLKPSMEGTVDAASRLSGRVRVGKGARIENSVIRGPVIIGEHARVLDSQIGPFTALGDQVTVQRSTVDHSVIMDGCSVVDIARLEDSLIGRRVVLRAGTRRYGALSLTVGDDCVVELSTQ